jgi:hypothetical protein
VACGLDSSARSELELDPRRDAHMSKGPAARILDPVAHPGAGDADAVLIGGKPAWRGVPAGAAAAISSAKATSDAAIKLAEANTVAAAGTPGLPAAKAAEETAKTTAATGIASMISGAAGGADIHACTTPLPVPPHGPGVDGSATVLINGLADRSCPRAGRST